jgi:Sec-independent protein secretion pathway component TatC
MARLAPKPEEKEGMSFLEHLDELRSRLFRSAIVFVGLLALGWAYSDRILKFLMVPFERHLGPRGDLVFLTPTEPFFVYLKASAVLALFLAMPFLLWQIWAFVSPACIPTSAAWRSPSSCSGPGFSWGARPSPTTWRSPCRSRGSSTWGLSSGPPSPCKPPSGSRAGLFLAMGLVFELPQSSSSSSPASAW